MLATNLLRAKIAEREATEREVASAIGVTMPTWRAKMENKTYCFDLAEMNKIVELLCIDDPAQIFFAQPVTGGVTSD